MFWLYGYQAQSHLMYSFQLYKLSHDLFGSFTPFLSPLSIFYDNIILQKKLVMNAKIF